MLAAGGTLIQRGHPEGNAQCRGTTNGGRSRDVRPSGKHSMKTETHTFTQALDSPNLGLLPGMGGGEMHLVHLDGFFSNRCCCQASSPNGFVSFLVFLFSTLMEISQFLHPCGTKNHRTCFTIYVAYYVAILTALPHIFSGKKKHFFPPS